MNTNLILYDSNMLSFRVQNYYYFLICANFFVKKCISMHIFLHNIKKCCIFAVANKNTFDTQATNIERRIDRDVGVVGGGDQRYNGSAFAGVEGGKRHGSW
jgi:hypothetical protein